MRVTCPQCQSQGLIDSAPLLHKASVTCVRCGATYEAGLTEGTVETALVSEVLEVHAVEPVAHSLPPTEICGTAEADEVLALPQVAELTEQSHEPVAVLALNAAAQPALNPDVEPVKIAVAAQVNVEQAKSDEGFAPALADSGAFQMPPEYAPQFTRADLVRPVEHDRYSLGVRLMRVSPVWLLVCGLVFIALVVALNGMTGAAEQVSSASVHAARANTTGNQATNQSAHTQTTARTARTNEPVQAAPVPANTNVQMTQAVADKPTVSTTAQRESVEARPISAPAPVPQAEANGKFTLQVGSFNNTVEANERAAHLQAAGFAAQVVAVELPKRGTWYRVQTGRFADRAEAAHYGAQLRAKGAADNFLVAEAAQ